VIEKSGKAVHLGGCGNPNQAVQMVNDALQQHTITEPDYTLIVSSSNVRQCVAEASVRFTQIL
jgi:hypothetical protein